MDSTAAANAARFVISTGDNFYNDGVPSVTSKRWLTSFEEIYTGSSLQVPWYVVLGNHDYRGNAQAQVDYSKRSKRWRMPSRYFKRSEKLPGGGTVELFFLDTNVFLQEYRRDKKYGDVAKQSPDAQLRWLEGALKGSDAEWRIVVGHHPLYSYGSHGNTATLIPRLEPLLHKYGVQLYLNGHDHDLQHITNSGVDYITSGAGSFTRSTKHGAGTQFAIGKTPGFVAFSVDRDSLRAQFIDSHGSVRHAFSRGR
jgi:acid phosphatase